MQELPHRAPRVDQNSLSPEVRRTNVPEEWEASIAGAANLAYVLVERELRGDTRRLVLS